MGNVKRQPFWEYLLRVSFSNDFIDNILLSYDNRLGSFPLNKLISARTLVDFQTIQTPAITLHPQRESVFNLSFYKQIIPLNLTIDFAVLSGVSNNENQFSSFDSYWIEAQNSQLKAAYKAISLILTKRLDNLPLTFVLEPEALFNSTENIDLDVVYEVQTKRYLCGLKVNSNFKSKPYNFNLYPKYSRFDFFNSLTQKSRKQEMFSLYFKTVFTLHPEHVFLDFDFRQVTFYRGDTADFNNINFVLHGTKNNIRWFLEGSNLTNDQNFLLQNITPNFHSTATHAVFGRFVKLGIAYKFK